MPFSLVFTCRRLFVTLVGDQVPAAGDKKNEVTLQGVMVTVAPEVEAVQASGSMHLVHNGSVLCHWQSCSDSSCRRRGNARLD